MIVRLLTAQVQPARLDDASRLFQEAVSPALHGQPGFRGAWLLLDRNTCKSIALTLWDSETDLHTGEGGHAFQHQLAQLQSLLASTPTRELYEVNSSATIFKVD
jgi:heme-degrading monooxygenase HmoA